MWERRRSPRLDTEQGDGRERIGSLPEHALVLCGSFTPIPAGADPAAGGITDAVAGLQGAPAPGDAGGSSGDGVSGDGEAPPGTGTIGYWENHPEAWPVTELVIAGHVLSQSELLGIFDINGGNNPERMAK